MLRNELQELVDREPFEPFRIKLVNGDKFDVVDPRALAVLDASVHIVPSDQSWVLFPIDKIASIESLLTDFLGQMHRHTAPLL